MFMIQTLRILTKILSLHFYNNTVDFSLSGIQVTECRLLNEESAYIYPASTNPCEYGLTDNLLYFMFNN